MIRIFHEFTCDGCKKKETEERKYAAEIEQYMLSIPGTWMKIFIGYGQAPIILCDECLIRLLPALDEILKRNL